MKHFTYSCILREIKIREPYLYILRYKDENWPILNYSILPYHMILCLMTWYNVVSNYIVSCDTTPYYVSHMIQYHAKRCDIILYNIIQSLKRFLLTHFFVRSSEVNLRSPLCTVRTHFAFTKRLLFIQRSLTHSFSFGTPKWKDRSLRVRANR